MEEAGTCSTVQTCNNASTASIVTESSMDSIKPKRKSCKKIALVVVVLVAITLVAAGVSLWRVWALIIKSSSPSSQNNAGLYTSAENKTKNGIQVGLFNPVSGCTGSQFQCSSGRCISLSWLCDGDNDCGNSEDEDAAICFSTTSTRSTTTTTVSGCTNSQFQCYNGRCISLNYLCDGDNDCGNWEDEAAATCLSYCDVSHGFLCQDGLTCIASRKRCNGVYFDCYDNSDEIGCGVSTTTTRPATTTPYCSGFLCPDGGCIPLSWLCDGDNDCWSRDDEVNSTCVSHCNASQGFMCEDGQQCIASRNRCDGVKQCQDGSDEVECVSYCSRIQGTMCNDGLSCIPNLKRCDGVQHCRDGSDEIGCTTITPTTTSKPRCASSQYQCPSTGQCVSVSSLCDGYSNCLNGEDETDAVCVAYCQISNGFMCKNGQQCIARGRHCDDIPQCRDGSDEIGCVCPPLKRPCRNGLCINENYWCDGDRDCYDGSDELPGCHKTCSATQRGCSKENICMSSNRVCDGTYDCSDGADETNCGNCTENRFQCKDTKCIDRDWVCDGKKDCSNGEDELLSSCIKCSSSEFQCVRGNTTCIPLSQRCDGTVQCTDASDEALCILMGADGAANPGDSAQPLKVTLRGQTNNYVCADSWNKAWSDVVCRHLGFADSLSTSTNLSISDNVTVLGVNASAYDPSRGPLSSLTDTGNCLANASVGISCKPNQCGMRAIPSSSAGKYVVNGDEAVRGAWPWQVYLQIVVPLGIATCGGSIINDRWILTAAHCVEEVIYPSAVTVYAGSIYFNNASDTEVRALQVDRVIMHTGYLYDTVRNVIINDVALLRLRQPLTFSETIRPICLAPRDVDLNKFKVCVATGWGRMRLNTDSRPTTLRQGKMMPLSNDACLTLNSAFLNYTWGAVSSDFDKMMCAGNDSPFTGVEVCKGDSGGPLACQDQNNVWSVVGVSSFVFGNCQTSVFARVSYYTYWIIEHILS